MSMRSDWPRQKNRPITARGRSKNSEKISAEFSEIGPRIILSLKLKEPYCSIRSKYEVLNEGGSLFGGGAQYERGGSI